MSMHSTSGTWRELLGRLTTVPSERQRVAEALGVNAYTVTRWIHQETEPRAGTLKKLPDVFPSPYRQQLLELIHAEFFPQRSSDSFPPTSHPLSDEIVVEHLTRTLAAYASIGGRFRAWSIRILTLQWAIGLLDPDQAGMRLTVVQCTPPRHGQSVRSLCEQMSIGTAPWDNGVSRRLAFLGAQSLSGWVVARGEPGVVQETGQNHGTLPVRSDSFEKSAAAWPFQREGKLAGCLLVESTKEHSFSPKQLSWMEVSANAAALSFRDEEFYDVRQIALCEAPARPMASSSLSLAHWRERIAKLRHEQEYRLSEAEAEVVALQQMEEEWLDAEHSTH